MVGFEKLFNVYLTEMKTDFLPSLCNVRLHCGEISQRAHLNLAKVQSVSKQTGQWICFTALVIMSYRNLSQISLNYNSSLFFILCKKNHFPSNTCNSDKIQRYLLVFIFYDKMIAFYFFTFFFPSTNDGQLASIFPVIFRIFAVDV